MGFRAIYPEGLLVLKLCARIDRRVRTKGDKDESDVLSLLAATPIHGIGGREDARAGQKGWTSRSALF